MSDAIKNEIRAFIVENFLFGDDTAPLADDQSLIASDLVDSTGILEMVTFLEERFGIVMADAEIVPANLDSIARIDAFVIRKRETAETTAG
ncbi:acyl carrier protein [Pseudaminobacter salicylatoxidans]|uniref:Acyl carrier protein n=1 Tax=Pseudaminobacter salicylatoxidans TaxID=93369 RepID=A0A316C8S3_PSESE|nr:acyl carrier protein [Pseudaminobacter salicylatoxidans]PWJ86195.1 acyl carrier protein [Pseudaminobacter salicylatoxidans]